MIASLPMYDWPEVRAATDTYWQAIRAALGHGPADLTRGFDDYIGHWQRPDLLLSQTCGMPYRTRLHGQVTLVGTPDYGLPGCAPGHYCSVLVVNAQDDRAQLSDFTGDIFAYNEGGSQSGWAAPATHAAGRGLRLTRQLATGSHRASLRAVAEGRAAMAAIDAATWELAQQYDPASARLRVLERTAPTPGLPYITARGNDPAPLAAAISAAIASLDASTRAALMLRGVIQIPASTYLAVPTPPPPGACHLPLHS
jgi:ABC-type phosphate/phosphonate transport system substrate-binding protein